MDSSDAAPLRLFNFGEAHVAGVLTMTALADFCNKHRPATECRTPGPSQTGLVCTVQIGIRRSYSAATKIIRRFRHSSFELRHSSRVRGRKLGYALTPSTHRPGCQGVCPLLKRFRSLDRDSNRSNRPSVSEHNHVIHRHRRRVRA
jgi:hypothetical protein